MRREPRTSAGKSVACNPDVAARARAIPSTPPDERRGPRSPSAAGAGSGRGSRPARPAARAPSLSGGRAGQEEAGHVRAGDEEDEPDRGLQHEQLARTSWTRSSCRGRRRRPRSRSAPAMGTSRRRPGGSSTRSSTCAWESGDSRPEARHHGHPAIAPVIVALAGSRRSGIQSCTEPEGKSNPAGMTPTILPVHAVDRDRPPHDRRIAAEPALPQQWPRITTWSRPGRSSPASNVRPRAAPRPSTAKRLAGDRAAGQTRAPHRDR